MTQNRTLTMFAALLGFAICGATSAAGPATGFSMFKTQGELKEHKPGVQVWTGGYVGSSVTDARKGPLHNAGWECSGQSVFQDGKALREGGQCVLTDADGDTVNALWERSNIGGAVGDLKTRGTYLSGTGKFVGIQGGYTLACRPSGSLAPCDITSGDYKLP